MDPIHLDSSVSVINLSQTENRTRERESGQGNISPLAGRDPFTSSHRQHRPQSTIDARLHELESENRRLHRLVAELLIKNQQLRRANNTA